jgi:hypothetical protein
VKTPTAESLTEGWFIALLRGASDADKAAMAGTVSACALIGNPRAHFRAGDIERGFLAGMAHARQERTALVTALSNLLELAESQREVIAGESTLRHLLHAKSPRMEAARELLATINEA